MKKKDKNGKNSVYQLVEKLILEIDQSSPSREQMLTDIKYMNYRIRPIGGDIFILAGKHDHLLRSLWKLSKIEEAVVHAANTLDDKQRDVFFDYIDSFENQMQRHIQDSMEKLSKSERLPFKTMTLEVSRQVKKRTQRDIN